MWRGLQSMLLRCQRAAHHLEWYRVVGPNVLRAVLCLLWYMAV